MSQTVYLTSKACTLAARDIQNIVSTVEKLSNSKLLASVSEMTDVHRRSRNRNPRKIQRALFGKRIKPFVFISCLN